MQFYIILLTYNKNIKYEKTTNFPLLNIISLRFQNAASYYLIFFSLYTYIYIYIYIYIYTIYINTIYILYIYMYIYILNN